MTVSVCALGPPKPGQKSGGLKKVLQVFIFLSAVGTLLSNVVSATKAARRLYEPPEIAGVGAGSGWHKAVMRSWAGAALVWCTSGLIGNVAAVLGLEALYRGRYRVMYALEGLKAKREA